jgi:predicted DNA-binding antitoxin AbrB/MazE fold protein
LSPIRPPDYNVQVAYTFLLVRCEAMTITVEAVYENGVLKLAEPLPLNERERVRLTIRADGSLAERTAGLLRWTGDPEVLRRVAEDDEFGILESP